MLVTASILPLQWPQQLNASLEEVDPDLYDIIEKEKNRQYKVLYAAPLCVITSSLSSGWISRKLLTMEGGFVCDCDMAQHHDAYAACKSATSLLQLCR